MRITALAGGTGAAKFLRGLVVCMNSADLTIIGNTGDDVEIWGLHVSPDLDTLTYALTGQLDEVRGWGRADETFRALKAMGGLGGDTWFQLGDRDLATHIYRTNALRSGASLTEVTKAIGRAFGLVPSLLPMSDNSVRTRVQSRDGWLSFQEYFVKEGARPDVVGVEYVRAEGAVPGPNVLNAIRSAEAVIICPSNPITSIGPILAIPAIRAALGEAKARKVAVSPIVHGEAVSGPAGRLMAARGLPASAAGVAHAYAPWLEFLILDRGDAGESQAVKDSGAEPILADLIMADHAAAVALARQVIETLAL